MQTASDCRSSAASSIARDAQHQAADRVGRAAAVVEHVGPRLVAAGRHVLAERTEQIREQRDRQIVRSDASRRRRRRSDRRRGRRRVRCRRRRRRGGAASRRAGADARHRLSPGSSAKSSARPAQTRRRRRSCGRIAPGAGAMRRESSRSARAPAAGSARRRDADADRRSAGAHHSTSGDAGAMVGGSRHHEQQVRQSVDVRQQLRLERVRRRADHRPLGPPADGPRDVQAPHRAGVPPARMNRRSGGSSASSASIQPPSRAMSSARPPPSSPVRRSDATDPPGGAPTANRSRWICSSMRADVAAGLGARDESEPGVQLVDVAIGGDTGSDFGTRVPSKSAVSPVAGPGVNFHRPDYLTSRWRTTPSPLPKPAGTSRQRRSDVAARPRAAARRAAARCRADRAAVPAPAARLVPP